MDWGIKWLVDFSAGKTELDSFGRSNNIGAIDMKMDGSVLEEKSYFKMLGLTFSSKLNWGSYISSIAKTASKEIGALIHSMKFLSSEVTLYLYKSTIWPFMEYRCHAWAGAPSCWISYMIGYVGYGYVGYDMELLDMLQKQICRTVVPSIAAFLDSLAHRQNIAT